MPDSPPIDGQALDFRDDLHHLINIERALTDEPLYGNCNLQQMQTTACRLFRYIEFRACRHATRSDGPSRQEKYK